MENTNQSLSPGQSVTLQVPTMAEKADPATILDRMLRSEPAKIPEAEVQAVREVQQAERRLAEAAFRALPFHFTPPRRSRKEVDILVGLPDTPKGPVPIGLLPFMRRKPIVTKTAPAPRGGWHRKKGRNQ